MKLTDQEQVILKAVERVGRNGLALIASVVKAVGYPKATTKKILISLSNKGAVSLHRHDWPQSLKPEQRKLLVKIGSDYYSAVSVRERNPTRFETGRRLSKAEKEEVLRSLGDSYKDHRAPKVLKSFNRDGDPIYGYEYNQDFMYRSDITGRLIRHYVTLPDGRRAHPTELYPNVSKAEIDKYAMEREAAEQLQQSRDRSRQDRIAKPGEESLGQTLKSVANDKYKRTGRKIEGSYFAQDAGGQLVRVDGKDAADVAHYEARGFMPAKSNPARKRELPQAWQVKKLSWGGFEFQSKHSYDDDVYKRPFQHLYELENYLDDHYGKAFAKKVIKAAEQSKGAFVGTVKRNPAKRTKGKITYARWAVSAIKPLYVYIKVEPDQDMKSVKYDAGSALINEFGPPTHSPARLVGDPVMLSELPDDVWEVKGAKSWAWIGHRRKQNPKQSKGKTALKKTGRALKGFAKGALSAGSEILGAGAMALNPAKLSRWKTLEKKEQLILKQLYRLVERDYHKATTDQQRHAILQKKRDLEGRLKDIYKERQKLFEKGEVNPTRRLKVKNKYIDLVIKGQAKMTPKGWQVGKKHFAQGRGTVNVSSGYYLDRHTGTVYAKRERNSARFSAVQWAKEMGRLNDIKPRPLAKLYGRSGGTPEQQAEWKERMREWNRQYRHASKMQKIALEEDNAAFRARQAQNKTKKKRNAEHKDSDHPIEVTRHYRAGPPGYLTPWQRAHHAGQSQLFETGIKPAKKRNPRKKVKGKKNASRVVNPSRKTKTGRARAVGKARNRAGVRSVAKTRKVATKRITRNPSAESIRKEFAGSVSGSRDLFFPQGTPQGLAKLGKLVLITTEEGTIKPVHGSAWLCADTKERLHIGSTSNAPLFDGPARSFGKVSKVEYESSKPHLGYKGPIIWFHHMGEESGHKPTLHADGKGGLVFRGGHYRLTKRGIEN